MELSKKQKQIFTWWCDKSPVKDARGIIADGSIRAGKTFSYRQSFVLWAMTTFDNEKFGICGKTIGSIKKNILEDLLNELQKLKSIGYTYENKDNIKCLRIKCTKHTNRFYLFAGNDE